MELFNKKKKKISEEESKKVLFYSLDAMDKIDAHYKMIVGERSNGKTFSVLERILKNYCENKGTGAIIRRWDMDIKPALASTFFDGVVNENLVYKYTNGQWTGVSYKVGKWYLSKWDDDLNKTVSDETPFCHAFCLSGAEHYKSTSYPNITTVLFDEFLTRESYLPNEFKSFTSIISTIIRYRNNVQIYMCANTVNKSSIYFTEFGIKHIDKIKQGEIMQINYDKGMRLAFEYCHNANIEGKPSDVYFAFDNPSIKMITGGAWEMEMYPHCPCKYKYSDIRFTYFIKWEESLLQCEIVRMEDGTDFTFIHEKTTPLQDETEDLIYCPEQNVNRNWSKKITVARNAKEQRVQWYFKNDKVFYQDNEVGEIVRNYLQWCKQN